MKKLYPLLSVLFLIYWGCEEEQPEEVDTTPTEVTLWGETYSIENTRYLIIGENQLTDSIPPEIGNLTNLTYLSLGSNQLTGEIPESICNLVDNNCIINISNNQLCSPYPSCVEDYVGTQDTSACP